MDRWLLFARFRAISVLEHVADCLYPRNSVQAMGAGSDRSAVILLLLLMVAEPRIQEQRLGLAQTSDSK